MNNEFLERFHDVRRRKRYVQLGQVVAMTLLFALAGFGALAFVDYWLELSFPARAASLTVITVAVVSYGARALYRTTKTWSQPATAAEIEQTFPLLGQSVRTTVQFASLDADQVQSAGVASTLVTALAEETNVRTKPLVLDTIVPKRRLWTIATATALGLVLLTGAAGVDWQWRTASHRAALGNPPYRSLLVEPGDIMVDEEASTKISVALIGRVNREVALYTRLMGQADTQWTERMLERQMDGEDNQTSNEGTPVPKATNDLPRLDFIAKLNRLTKPLEYRVVAGELESDTYRIDIRRPLKIQDVQVDLTPPSYTGQPTSSVQDGNLSVLQGTLAQFAVTFDKPVKSAALVFSAKKSLEPDVVSEPEIVPLTLTDPAESEEAAGTPTNGVGSAQLALNEDRSYSIVAEAADGTRLVENKYRIRVREDQPPQVFFESPDDGVEVHTLAELPMRIRVQDDYGLTTAGVIFQVNNEQEIPLIAEDFAIVAQAATEATENGRVSPSTQAALEKILPLEHFELTQKDSVMYFAYAEDNLPDRPQRTETDMRFIDIRPFKRQYRLLDPDPMAGMGMGIGFKSLEELIQRQRFALNRTIQIEKRAAVGRNPDPNPLDQLMKFETELAQAVRETAQGLESRGFDDTELFYQAEAAMLQAVDSLSVGKWDNATLQMRDALKFLIEQRERTILAIFKNPDPARLAALRAFDRQQAQKLRRPKTDKQEARELIRRLEQLTAQEKDVVAALQDDSSEPAAPNTEQAEKPQPVTDTTGDKSADTENK